MQDSEKEKYKKKIRELEKRIRELEEGKEEREKKAEEQGEKSGSLEILRTLSRKIGLEGVIKGVETLPEFQERLKEVDGELRSKLKSTPLKRTEGNITFRKRGFKPRTGGGRARSKKETGSPAEKEVDIFDEDDFILAVLEIPGADEKSINVNAEKDKLTVKAERAGRKYSREVILPCVPEGEITRNYRNGILEVKIAK